MWRRRAHVLWRTLTDGVMILVPGTDEPVLVSGPGASVWELLGEPISMEALRDVLVELYDAPPDVVAHDLVRLLDDLARHGAVEAVQP